jgi:hypothetical protein
MKQTQKTKNQENSKNIKTRATLKKPENNLEIIKISLSTYFKKTKEYELKKIWNEIHYFEMS